jgi:uncharacterized protein
MPLRVGEQALKWGLRENHGACGIVFFGGEPLVEKDTLTAIVELGRAMEARDGGIFHFKITTNGLLMDEAFLEWACRRNVMIAMSFDGVKEAHDAHRRAANGGGTYERVLPRLKALLHAKPYSSILMVVNPDTVRHLAASAEFLVDLGVQYLIISLNYAAAWTTEDLDILRGQYLRLARDYARWSQLGRKFYVSPFEVKLSSHINQDCFDKERCDLGARQLSVDPEGNLFPCVQFVKAGRESRWCVGSVFQGLDRGRLKALNEESHQEKELCRLCELKGRCGHTCSCLNWQTSGTITSVSPVLCAHEKMLIEIADRLGNLLYRRKDARFIQKHYNKAYPLLSLMEDALKGG